MQGNSTLMSGHGQKVLSCIEVGPMSQTTLSSIMAWCMHTMELQSQDTPDDGKCWNWCRRTTGGQGCPGMSPNSSQDAVMVQPPFPFSAHLWLPLTPSTSAPPLLPPLCSNSEAYLCNLCNCIAPTLRLTTDQYWTHLDLVPMPRATVYIPFLHLSYLPDPFSLTIMGNYSFLV